MALKQACVAAGLAILANAALADGNQMYVRGGTMGVGVGYATALSERINARVGFNY